MFIQFYVENYKIFKEKAVLSMIASNYDKECCPENLISGLPIKSSLLKSAVIYGKNAAGKSKLIDALHFMGQFIKSSSKNTQAKESIDVTPFLLNTKTREEPSVFEIIFLHNEIQYRYGFEVDKKRVHSEWLYYKPKIKEIELFYREGQNFEKVHSSLKAAKYLVKDEMIRENALLLSTAAQFNDKICVEILNWFEKVAIISGLKEEGYKGFSIFQLNNPREKKEILNLLKYADIGIEDLSVTERSLEDISSEMPEELKKILKNKEVQVFSDLKTVHSIYDETNLSTGNFEIFSMNNDESSGTDKYFSLSGPLLDTLEKGDILIIDEMDAKLHPNLARSVVKLFNSKETNPHNAQVVFTTHNTNLLKSDLFRRDQIWFTEKDRYGAATLYSLGDFKVDEKKIRNDEDYEKNYLQGRYGGIPYLEDFKINFED